MVIESEKKTIINRLDFLKSTFFENNAQPGKKIIYKERQRS